MMRRPTISERILQAVIFVVLIFASWDVITAFNGVACRDFTELDAGKCYPWGWDGPFADLWFYRSREVYLRAGLLRVGIVAAAFALPFFVRRRWLALTLMALLMVAAYPALVWAPYVTGIR